MTVAGIGCRRACPAADIVAIVRRAEALTGCRTTALAAPDFKRHEPGLHAAAATLGLPIHFIPQAALERAQADCVTHSGVALQTVGLASVAEGAALAATNGTLLLPRIVLGAATCAVAG